MVSDIIANIHCTYIVGMDKYKQTKRFYITKIKMLSYALIDNINCKALTKKFQEVFSSSIMFLEKISSKLLLFAGNRFCSKLIL